VSGGRWRRWQRAALPHLVGRRVLDVGCGPGHFLSELIAAGYDAYGLEQSTEMWAGASRRLARKGQPGHLIAGDALELPFADASFDALVLTFPPPFVRDARFWSEAARVLGPSGRVVVVEGATSNARLWPGILERIWEALEGHARAPEETPVNGRLNARRITTTTPDGTIWLIVADKTQT